LIACKEFLRETRQEEICNLYTTQHIGNQDLYSFAITLLTILPYNYLQQHRTLQHLLFQMIHPDPRQQLTLENIVLQWQEMLDKEFPPFSTTGGGGITDAGAIPASAQRQHPNSLSATIGGGKINVARAHGQDHQGSLVPLLGIMVVATVMAILIGFQV
jgi:hypothetical protein